MKNLTAAGVVATGISSLSSAKTPGATRQLKKIGLQLYTVRSEMERDFERTLARVAATGYQEVEFAGYYERKPAEVKAILAKNGLSAPSTHLDIQSFRNSLVELLEAAHIIGHEYVVCPWLDPSERRTLDDWKHRADEFNRFGETCRKAGIQFAYHNHDFEFHAIEGKMPYDVLLAATDPTNVHLEMDLFWTVNGGADPATYFAKCPGRFAMVHVKDRKTDGTMVDVGSGSIDFSSIFARAEQAGIQHYFVEEDNTKWPLESIRHSHEFLSRLRF